MKPGNLNKGASDANNHLGICDLCGCESNRPEDELFDWDGFRLGCGTLDCHYTTTDGDYDEDRVDLCYECATALGGIIANPSKRQELLALIGRDRHE